ncbi:uncharacterized protein LOC124111193 isoform X2 [Haliotis rufescens]|uniref:uncharacterized protein LOC124111193 isoform X2 n=1 Tax=Haliotis rufescens TaxID=6454 RepID=UPI00201F54D2|nr:uncharacterized protein LOC124111193 isoform X2 [Haliotis rufescens]
MGVRGLWTYCKENLSSCAKLVDLIRVARQRHGIDILVDLCAFQVFLSSKIFEALANVTDNPYLEILGGEYGAIDAYTSKLISDLRSLGIELIFFVDGCQGSSLEVNVRKTPVWKERYEGCVEVQRNTIRMCAGDIGRDDLTHILGSHLTTLQFTSTLEACGCRVHNVPEEADTFIAKTFETMKNAYAVLTNDTDFCIFNGCISIFNDLFDMTNSLKPEPGASVPDKPKELICLVFKSEVIGKSLGFQHHSQLIELSIIAGNDNTGRFMREFRYLLSLRGRFSMQKAANWVKEYGRVENHPAFAKKLDQYPAFRQAVKDSRLFYLLQCCEPDGDKGEVHSLLNDGILRGSLPSELLAIHNRVFWHGVSIEQPSLCDHTSDTALTELRRRIYRMVLPQNVDTVDEFGLNSQGHKCECISVKAINDERVPHICSIQQDAIHENLLHFEWMITHLEGGAVKSWFEMFERTEGFLCYILRYFLLLNWKHNLCITEMEFCALVALVFGHRDERWYQGLSLKPSPRCVTMSAWFQSLYMHAYILITLQYCNEGWWCCCFPVLFCVVRWYCFSNVETCLIFLLFQSLYMHAYILITLQYCNEGW